MYTEGILHFSVTTTQVRARATHLANELTYFSIFSSAKIWSICLCVTTLAFGTIFTAYTLFDCCANIT